MAITFSLPYTEDNTNEIVQPKFEQPIYDDEGHILWSPRIVGGSPAALGEFRGKVFIYIYLVFIFINRNSTYLN